MLARDDFLGPALFLLLLIRLLLKNPLETSAPVAFTLASFKYIPIYLDLKESHEAYN
jgi:hypothetical protein